MTCNQERVRHTPPGSLADSPAGVSDFELRISNLTGGVCLREMTFRNLRLHKHFRQAKSSPPGFKLRRLRLRGHTLAPHRHLATWRHSAALRASPTYLCIPRPSRPPGSHLAGIHHVSRAKESLKLCCEKSRTYFCRQNLTAIRKGLAVFHGISSARIVSGLAQVSHLIALYE